MYRFMLIVIFALLNVSLIQAQDVATEMDDATPAETESTSSVCNPEELNWCFAGQPWGDGRCNTSDPNETAYFYIQGYYEAVAFCEGGSTDSASTTVANSSDQVAFSCQARVDRGEVTLRANWGTPVKNQARAVFRFDIEILEEDINNGVSVDLVSVDVGASGSRQYGDNVELEGAVAYIIDAFDTPITNAVTCSISN